MYTFLLVLLVLDSFALLAVVLLQSGKGGGLAASFGGAASSADTFMGTRQMGTVLTKASWWTGGIFMALAFILSSISQRAGVPRSVIQQGQTPPPAEQQVVPPAPSTAVPLAPAAPGGQPDTSQKQPPAQGQTPPLQP